MLCILYPASCIVQRVLPAPVGQQPLHHGRVVLVDLDRTRKPVLARRVLGRQQVPLPALAPHKLARAGHFDPLRGASIGLQFHLRHGIPSFRKNMILQYARRTSGIMRPASWIYFALVPSIRYIFLPSMRGCCSMIASFSTSLTMRSSRALPNAGWAISLPRNMMLTFTLWPSARNRLMLFTLKLTS